VDIEQLEARIAELETQNANMKEELARLYGVDRPFICGDVGELDTHGLREYYLVCPSYGSAGFVLYKKHKEFME